MKTLDMSIRRYENIIIAAHALDVLIFFYDFITPRSLVIVCTKPKSQNDFISLNNLIIKKASEMIILEDIDTYSPDFVLSPQTKYFLNSIKEYGYDRVITQVRATSDSDKVAREIYDYISLLKLDNHHMINFDLANNNEKISDESINKKNNIKPIPKLFLDIAFQFTGKELSVEYLAKIYSTVKGTTKKLLN